MITGVVKVGHMKKRSSEKMNVWFGKFCSTVDKKGRSQYIFHNSTNVFEINNIFSDRVIFFISTTIFQINNFFSNLKTSQIEKSFLNQHKNETSRNMFQIQKKIEILKSFSNCCFCWISKALSLFFQYLKESFLLKDSLTYTAEHLTIFQSIISNFFSRQRKYAEYITNCVTYKSF